MREMQNYKVRDQTETQKTKETKQELDETSFREDSLSNLTR